MKKNGPANAADLRDWGSIPGLGGSPGGGHGSPLQYSFLGSPMDREAQWDAVHGVAKSGTRLKRLSTHTQEERTTSLPSGSCNFVVYTHVHKHTQACPHSSTDREVIKEQLIT